MIYKNLIFIISTLPLLRNEFKMLIPILLLYIFKKNIYLLTLVWFYYIRNLLFIFYTLRVFLNKIDKDNVGIKQDISMIFNNVFNFQPEFKNIPTCNTIFVVNYPKIYYECFALLLLPKKITILMQDKMLSRIFCDNFLYKPVYRKKKYGKSYKNVRLQIKQRLKENISVAALVSTEDTKLVRIRTGIFKIAKELNIPVTPVVIDTIDISTDCRILKQNFKIYVGESFYVSDNLYNDTYRVKKLFKEKIEYFKNTKYIF